MVKKEESVDNGNEHPDQNKNILIVEADLLMRFALAKTLSLKNYNYKCVSNEQEAISALNQEMFDLIIIDNNLKSIDGIITTKTIRGMKDKPYHSIPIIGMGYCAGNETEKAFLDAGANTYGAKPIRMEELYSIIDDLL